MALHEIARDLQVTDSQRDRTVSTVDTTDTPLSTRLAPFAADLPCEPAVAASLVEGYLDGKTVDGVAEEVDVVPMVAAKTLHLLGFQGISPLDPADRDVVRAWIDGTLDRDRALERADCPEEAFVLGAFVEVNEPLSGAKNVVERRILERRWDRKREDSTGRKDGMG